MPGNALLRAAALLRLGRSDEARLDAQELLDPGSRWPEWLTLAVEPDADLTGLPVEVLIAISPGDGFSPYLLCPPCSLRAASG